MRTEDVLPPCMAELDDLKEEISLSTDKRSDWVDEVDSTLRRIERRMKNPDYFGSVESDEDLSWIFDTLCAEAPDYMYFGAHEGDGSDYGWWIDSDAIMSYRVPTVHELPEQNDEGDNHILVVSDYGNATLYAWTTGWKECWAAV